jgi:hypothetical protein
MCLFFLFGKQCRNINVSNLETHLFVDLSHYTKYINYGNVNYMSIYSMYFQFRSLDIQSLEQFKLN